MIRKLGVLILILTLTIHCGSEKKTEPTVQTTSPSGNTVHISLSVKKLAVSLEFFGTLGFRKSDSREDGQNPWALISDGRMLIMLSQNPFPSPGLTYYAPDMKKRVEQIEQSGFKFDDILSAGGKFSSAVVRSPGGVGFSLIAFDDKALPKIKEPFEVKCGSFQELSVPVNDIKISRQFWQNLGFKPAAGDSATGPVATLTDGLIRLGLYQNAVFPSPALTYSVKDLKINLQLLEQAGIPIGKQPAALQGKQRVLQIVSPDNHFIRIVEE